MLSWISSLFYDTSQINDIDNAINTQNFVILNKMKYLEEITNDHMNRITHLELKVIDLKKENKRMTNNIIALHEMIRILKDKFSDSIVLEPI